MPVEDPPYQPLCDEIYQAPTQLHAPNHRQRIRCAPQVDDLRGRGPRFRTRPDVVDTLPSGADVGFRAWCPSLLRPPCLLNADEPAGLVAWPLGDVSLPGLSLGGTRALAPSAEISRYGRVVLQSTYPGMQRPLALSLPDSLRHLHVIGPTGVGKSTLLLGLICQDMAAGRGVIVVDPKGDLVADVLDR